MWRKWKYPKSGWIPKELRYVSILLKILWKYCHLLNFPLLIHLNSINLKIIYYSKTSIFDNHHIKLQLSINQDKKNERTLNNKLTTPIYSINQSLKFQSKIFEVNLQNFRLKIHQTEKIKKRIEKKKFNSKALQLLNIYFRNTVTPSFPLISKANLASSKNKSRQESREFFSSIDTTSFQSNRGGTSLPTSYFPFEPSQLQLPFQGVLQGWWKNHGTEKLRRKWCSPGKTLFRTFERSDSTIFEFLDDTWGEPCAIEQARDIWIVSSFLHLIHGFVKCWRWTSFGLVWVCKF